MSGLTLRAHSEAHQRPGARAETSTAYSLRAQGLLPALCEVWTATPVR